MSLITPIQGIIPPMVTPLNSDFSLDEASLPVLIEHIISGGVHGLFILGTTGEFASLSKEVKKKLIELTCQIVNKRVPVLVGISDCSFQESIELASLAKKSGADILVATNPFYVNVDQDELINYFSRLADEVALPLFLYNMPSHTGIHLELETIKSLAKHSNIIGIKDSSGNKEYFQQLCEAFKNQPGFTVLMGPEEILKEAMEMGGSGGVTGGANLFPKLYVQFYESIKSGNLENTKKLNETVQFLSQNLYQQGTYKSSYLKGLKASLSFEGLCPNVLALPLTSFDEDEVTSLKERYAAVKESVNSNLSK
ncbi:dihydrodipicolinate synthase family protein [Algoriphagus machipongonensis]|uniref:Dihydrodipicolinate synthase n=1 Tax=Algoriphagus machipongonensis TaxID=388413 RepID=A3HWI0_9BACT|nr:dihydrodipicolinate synthase family protein [Algoriphagus machipongonensis]EAZ80953.1 dihydrodipicolinate synthase [Algoriphagus machipongonensis]